MTSPSTRTVDDLGLEASVRYAHDQKTYDKKYVEESRIAPTSASVAVVSGDTIPSEIDALLGLAMRSHPWGLFSPPPGYLIRFGDLFDHQLAPSLGMLERLEGQMQTLEEQKGRLPPRAIAQNHQCVNLLALHATVMQLDQIVSELDGRRMQYTRG